MRILVSNDDGIFSPGLLALAEAASDFGAVRVVAPDVEQSSMGQAITGTPPLSYRRTPLAGFEAYRVNGTPSDCVALGLSQWADVDLVVSGINLGLNLGNAVWHSGTLAAAKQGVLLGTRGIAFSAPAEPEPNFVQSKPHIAEALQLALTEKELPLLNVNLPCKPRGVCWTRQSFRHYDGKIVPAKDPMGRQHYWFTVVPIEEIEEGTDRWAIEHNFTSITPLRLDLTDEAALQLARRRHACQANGKVRPAPPTRKEPSSPS